MGVFSQYDATLQEVARVMEDQPADTQLEYRLDRLISELDELCGVANSDPAGLERHTIAIGQIMTRAQLLGSFILARKSQFKVVGRG